MSDADGQDPPAADGRATFVPRGTTVDERVTGYGPESQATGGGGGDGGPGGGGSDDEPPEPPALPGGRYRILGLIARGGQGDVWRVADEWVGQDLALKIVRAGASENSVARFRAEIRRTVQLAHPGVVPVFDQGEVDGRPWFVMRWVDGEHLGDVVRAIYTGQRPRNLRRLVELFVGLCAAVDHAHIERIVHRDLTPRNVMVSAFDEPLVMDWGLAERLPERPRQTPPRSGRPPGTTGYIAPECYADPDHIDCQVDVFGLGATLFKALTGQHPPDRRAPTRRDFPPRWADGQPLPPPLVEICLQATAADPACRLRSAHALGQRLLDWLDGARRRDEALALLERARSLLDDLDAMRADVVERWQQARLARLKVPDHAPATEKYAAWDLEDEARRLEERLAHVEMEFERLAGAALTRVPDLPEAHRLLARHHRARAEAAEDQGDRASARRAEALVRLHDRGQHAEWLDGIGRLDLVTEPPGARVTLHRLIEVRRRLEPGPGEVLGSTPIEGRRLSGGRYLAVIESAGRPAVRYPVSIERGEHWRGIAPGEDAPRPIPLVTPPTGAVYVPPGWASLGGDREAPFSLPRCRIWVDGFFVQRFSVTHRQWITFLDALADRAPDEASRHEPRAPNGQSLYHREPDGRVRVVSNTNWQDIDLDAPVFLVSWESAALYARWLAEHTGHAWRLPTHCEWEKASRGVDGRLFPWGDEAETSWSVTAASFDGLAVPLSVHACPEDESIYGVRGTVGCIRNWCISSYRIGVPADRRDRILPPEGDEREVRGGAWSSMPFLCRPAARMSSRATDRFRAIGLRLVCSVPAAPVSA